MGERIVAAVDRHDERRVPHRIARDEQSRIGLEQRLHALDVAGALAVAAVQVGQFAQDMHAQYAEPVPWLLLGGGELTGVSSIMPQKRNPAALEQLRAQASIMLGDMQTVLLIAHNNRTGMFDYRGYDPVPVTRPLQVFELLKQILEALVVDKERALAEVNADYSTTTEIADVLMQKADIPFRAGHHFASKLTDYGRARGLALHEIPYLEAARLYEADAGQTFPLSETEFRDAIDAEKMVFGRRVTGGSQPAEVQRMLASERAALEKDRAWLADCSDRLVRAEAGLNQAFGALAGLK